MTFNSREMSRDSEQHDVRCYKIFFNIYWCRDPINWL